MDAECACGRTELAESLLEDKAVGGFYGGEGLEDDEGFGVFCLRVRVVQNGTIEDGDDMGGGRHGGGDDRDGESSVDDDGEGRLWERRWPSI